MGYHKLAEYAECHNNNKNNTNKAFLSIIEEIEFGNTADTTWYQPYFIFNEQIVIYRSSRS